MVLLRFLPGCQDNCEEDEDPLPPQHRLERGNDPEGEESEEEAQARLKRQRRADVPRVGQLADSSAELGAIRHNREPPHKAERRQPARVRAGRFAATFST